MSYLDIKIHFVFATAERRPFIHKDWRTRLHEYLGGCARDLDCVPIRIGGVEDHIHLLFGLRGEHAPAEVMRQVKRGSSAWVHREIGEKAFAWQEGYAAFSVSASGVDRVARYIENQEEHHRKRSSLEELEILLRRHGIVHDPRFLA